MPRNYYIPVPIRLAQLLARTRLTENGCRLWTGYIEANGYSKTCVHGKWDWTHRHVYRLVFGEIPKGIEVCHKCDVRGCMEPSHLFLGTHKENMVDALKKGRTARGFKLPHTKLTPQQRLSIIERAKTGEKYELIARDFGIHKYTPAMIARSAGIYRNRSKRL